MAKNSFYFLFSGYQVEKKRKGSDTWEPAMTGLAPGTEATIPLPEGSEWEFRVKAVNNAGPGDPSIGTGNVKVKSKIGKD